MLLRVCSAHHSVLDTEAQLVLGVRPLDLDLDHGGTRHSGQLHSGFVLTVLKDEPCYIIPNTIPTLVPLITVIMLGCSNF